MSKLSENKSQKEENVMEYWIFLPDVIVGKEEIYAILGAELTNHIWQKDPFFLDKIKDSEDLPEHLYGRTDYADNVEDLWFICYLLYRLSGEMKNSVVKMRDSDGEFLLIEAADQLPNWVNPESIENRVFVHSGELHIIPKATHPGEITPIPSGVPLLSTAVKYVQTQGDITRASQAIQDAINKRLKRFPKLARKNIQSTTCYLPVNAARLLAHDPQLISEAVQAFYLRDPIDLKLAASCVLFSPETRVNCKVKLTRCMYAQLMQQKFYPPKRSTWKLPSTNSPEHRAHDLGMKISYGLSILCGNAQKSSQTSAAKQSTDQSESTAQSTDQSGDTVDVTQSNSWKVYYDSLNRNNYFQNELEGSVKHKQLLQQALLFFKNDADIRSQHTEGESPRSSSSSRTVQKGQKILSLLESCPVSEEDIRQSCTNLLPDDDDSWLYLTYEELDSMLSEYSSGSSSQTDFQPNHLVDKMNSFISKQSNLLTGVETPNDSEIQFNSKGFLAAIEKMMNGDEGDFVDSDDSLSDYDSDDSPPPELSRPAANSNPNPAHSNGMPAKDDTGGVSVSEPLLNGAALAEIKTSGPKPPPRTKSAARKASQKAPLAEEEPELEDFMEMMDRELSKTNIGKSFEKRKQPPKRPDKPPATNKSKASPSKVKASSAPPASLAMEEDLSDSDGSEIDVDLNTVKNLLESYDKQLGLPGPASTLLESMGLKLPQNSDS